MRENMDYILESIGEAAAYEQLAEECTELAKAALKKARILRGDNPTPVLGYEADRMVREEFTDVMDCADILGLATDYSQRTTKIERWISRINEAKNRKEN